MRSKPKLLLIHFSDLFYGSGTAVIYRRLLSLLPDEVEIHHCISTWLSHSQTAINARYETELSITPHFAPHKPLRDVYGRLSRRWNGGVPDLRLPGRLDAENIRKTINTIRPDVIWWSGDYLPISSYAFNQLKSDTFTDVQLRFSLYDPPGFWNSGKWDFKPHLQQILQRIQGVDVIGNNMATLVKESGFPGEPVILNDYVENTLEPATSKPDAFRIAITGQIYGGEMFQHLIDKLSKLSIAGAIEIHWFGNNQNLKVADGRVWPQNVKLVKRGLLPRDEIATHLQSFDAGYLNMPKETDGFGKYSVPTKLITYLEARLPVIFHAPLDSEIQQMNEQYRFGINLENTDEIISIRNKRSEFQEWGGKLIQERYNKDSLKQRLLEYLGLNE